MRHIFNPMISLSLALLVLSGCGKKKHTDLGDPSRVVSAEMLIFDEDTGEVIKAGELEPFTGKAVWVHPNGQRQQETTYVDGRENGQEIWWHPDGARAGQSEYQTGVLNGSTIQWHPGGVKMEFQVLYQNGMQDGKEVWWHENGREKSVTHFENGLRQGRATGWFSDGSKAWEAMWADDEPQGRYAEWYETGQMKSQKQYDAGKQTGSETWWYENGEKSWKANWKEGRQAGVKTEWYESGKKMSETFYKAGRREGTAAGWYENGNKAHETTYLDDEEVAVKEWNEDGSEVAAAPDPQGRVRVWATGEIEKLYSNTAEGIVYTDFGEPDRAEGGAWVYENVQVRASGTATAHEVEFTFQSGKVKTVKVTVPPKKQTP
jgi:antitoxin component YwqK of YwqJK toxin-antitoxin module